MPNSIHRGDLNAMARAYVRGAPLIARPAITPRCMQCPHGGEAVLLEAHVDYLEQCIDELSAELDAAREKASV